MHNYANSDYLKTASHVSCLEPLALGPDVRSNSCTTSEARISRLKRSASFWRQEERGQLSKCRIYTSPTGWLGAMHPISLCIRSLYAGVITFLSVALSFSSPLQQTRSSWRARLILLNSGWVRSFHQCRFDYSTCQGRMLTREDVVIRPHYAYTEVTYSSIALFSKALLTNLTWDEK